MACGCGDEKIYKREIISCSNNEQTAVVVQGGSSAECLDEWLKSNSATNNTIPIEHKIQKTPRVLRQLDESCYEPQVISIGPYHHGKEELMPMEKLKIRLTREYVDKCRIGTSADQLYYKIAGLVEAARKCYADDNEASKHHFDDKKFTLMMFVDGCFLLQFIFCSIEEKKEEKLKLKNHDIAFIQKDLFLLENQLPFIVLKALMSFSSFGVTEGLKKIKQFINSRDIRPPPASWWEMAETCFADLIKFLFKSNFIAYHIKYRRRRGDEREPVKYEGDPAHLLELMRREIIDPNAFNVQDHQEGENYKFWYSYRSVQELKAAGIIFRPNRSKPNILTDVRYEPLFVRAVLRLPVMTIDDSTRSLLLNLVAYEMCPDSPDDFGVTSYLWLMDTLIDNSDDVKELRRKGILLNALGSDEQVSKLFNEIADNLVANSSAYANVKPKIEEHYKNKIKVWITELLHTHFNTPWTVLAFIGAIIAIALSFIQSYYAINPRK